jgi:hypothetical protein
VTVLVGAGAAVAGLVDAGFSMTVCRTTTVVTTVFVDGLVVDW